MRPSRLGAVGKETPSKNKDASHKAFVLCALIPLLTLADGGAGAGHGAPLKLRCSASQGFSLCHRLGFRWGPVWQLQMVGLVRAPLPCARGCLHMSLLWGSELPLKSFIPPSRSGAERETGPWWALQESDAYVPSFIRLP